MTPSEVLAAAGGSGEHGNRPVATGTKLSNSLDKMSVYQ